MSSNPSDQQVQEALGQQEALRQEEEANKLQTWPDTLAFLAYFLGLAGLGFFAQKDYNFFLDYGMALTCVYFGFKGYRHGFFYELGVILRFGASILIGYEGRNQVGDLIGLPGILGAVAGFYILFFLTYVLTGFMIRSWIDPRQRPALPIRVIGLGVGVIEGIALFSFLGFLAAFFAAQGNAPGGFTAMLGDRLSNGWVEPFLEQHSNGPMVLMKLAQEARNGVDPAKIDGEAIKKQLGQFQTNPKFKAIAEDPDIVRMAKEKNMPGLLKHPKVISLLSDGDLQKVFATIDWPSIASAVRMGIKPPLPGPPPSADTR